MMFRVKPLKKNVVDPKTGAPLSETGLLVNDVDSYWFRRARDKDVSLEEVASQEEADRMIASGDAEIPDLPAKKKESK